MKISLNLDSIALLLFCSDIVVSDHLPLTSDEWYEIERKLRSSSLKEPSRLFGMSKEALEQILELDEYITAKMIARTSLYDELMHALYNIQNEGINITTKYEDNFPEELNNSLKRRSPLYLYYVGDLALLKNMVSIVGLHQNDRRLQKVTKQLVIKLLSEDRVLVNGDAKGIEAYALKLYLKQGGKTVCFVSDHMLEKKQFYNKYIKEGQMVLLSAVDPYAFFDVTNALDRNIYVCGLCQYQFVIASYINSGSTWFTALQNLHYQWTNQLVYEDTTYNGNIRLLEMGGIRISKDDIYSLNSIDTIMENNQNIDDIEEIEIDQMSIFEFIED